MRWITQHAPDGTDMIYTGTVSSPLASGIVCQEFIKNESGKDRVYRWRCTSYTSGTLPAYINKHSIFSNKFKFGEGMFLIWDNEAPMSGVDGDGAGFAAHNSLYADTSASGALYRNQGTAANPNWTTV